MYRFIRGHVSSSEDLTSESVWRGVARRLGQWHATLPINSFGKTAVVADAGMEVLLKSSAPASTASLEEINAITPSKPTPNVWTVLQKWVFALPTTCETEVERKRVLQKELERIVADLGDTPGLGGNGVPWRSEEKWIRSLTNTFYSSWFLATRTSSAATSLYNRVLLWLRTVASIPLHSSITNMLLPRLPLSTLRIILPNGVAFHAILKLCQHVQSVVISSKSTFPATPPILSSIRMLTMCLASLKK